MDEELDRLVVSVRADTRAFAAEVAAMRGEMDGSLGAGAERAGRAIENALGRAVRSGKLGFDDLKRVALSALSEIAVANVRSAVGGGGGGIAKLAATGIGAMLGLPGRATGGPVTGGNAYVVGERGPELFVPGTSGTVVPGAASRGPVSVTVNVAAPPDASQQSMARTGQQLARAVRRALDQAEG